MLLLLNIDLTPSVCKDAWSQIVQKDELLISIWAGGGNRDMAGFKGKRMLGSNKIKEGFEGQGKELVLEIGAHWEPVEGYKERCHVL